MLALVYDHSTQAVTLEQNHPKPTPAPGDALIRVLRAGVCATDLEITRGYVPGYCQILGHEFVGVVVSCATCPELVGRRVVGEINCNVAGYSCNDAIWQRNHAPGRQVLGIIDRPGCFATFTTLPAANLHVVPDSLTDAEAAFCEPLAAAARILEQGLLQQPQLGVLQPQPITQRVAVVGDGRLGLLVAQVLALHAPGRVTHFGRHASKMALVAGTAAQLLATPETVALHAATFTLVVEASGSAGGIRSALQLAKPMGTVVCKTTVALGAPDMPSWSEIANDVVVNEKALVGSRCGPMDAALQLMVDHEPLRALLRGMLQQEVPLEGQGLAALELAGRKGVLKVQLVMPAS